VAVSPVVWLVALFVVSVVVYAVVGTRHVLFDITPDEVQYAKLSQNFALGRGLEFRGTGVGYPPLYPVLLSWVWQFGSAVEGYQLGKVFGAVLASTVVFPVWLLGRELVGPRLALVPAALCVTGAWMSTTSFLVSENLAFPLAAASLACTVMAVRDPRARWVLASVGFAVPAVLARTQLAALPVILVVALVLDVVRQPPGSWWARVRERPWWLWALLVAGVVVGLIVYAADPGLTGYPILTFPVTAGQVLKATGRHAISAINMFAFVPIVAAVALMARRSNWRDDASGPVLVTLSAAVLVLLPLLGFYEAYAAASVPVDRYGMYLAPLLFLCLVLAPGRIGRRAALISAVAVAIVMAWTPLVRLELEQPALLGSQLRIGALGLSHGGLRVGFVVLALVVAGAGVIALTWHSRGRGLAAAAILVAAVMVTQSWTSQAHEIHQLRRARQTLDMPRLDWVDRRVDAPVGEFNLAVPQTLVYRFLAGSRVSNPNDITDFYNKSVDRMYAAVPTYDACRISIGRDGVLVQAGGPTCAPWPRYLVVVETPVTPAFAGQRVLTRTLVLGSLVQLPPGPPRLLGVVQPPCSFDRCSGLLGITVLLHSPGTLVITFGPSAAPQVVTLPGGRRWTLPAGGASTARLTVASGFQKLALPVSWSSSQGAPQLVSIALQSAGKTTRLY
jgi:hypothetical protein